MRTRETKARQRGSALVGLALLASACTVSAPAAGPAATGAGSGSADQSSDERSEAALPVGPGYVEADVRFMQDMIVHHAQALEMTALVPDRTAREDMRLLARRIAVSQQDEIGMMERWLTSRDEAVPEAASAATGAAGGAGTHGEHARGGHGAQGHTRATGHAGMPGMATPEQLARLGAAEGEAFDRLFLELMIRHHEGALVMVRELLATEGAGQEPEIFQFASHVDADQRTEIARMRRLLDTLDPGTAHGAAG